MGTYWLDAGGLFYCSFRDPEPSTLVCHEERAALVRRSVRRRPIAGKIPPAAGGEHGFGDSRERENLLGGS
jgi:hypothetical protein